MPDSGRYLFVLTGVMQDKETGIPYLLEIAGFKKRSY